MLPLRLLSLLSVICTQERFSAWWRLPMMLRSCHNDSTWCAVLYCTIQEAQAGLGRKSLHVNLYLLQTAPQIFAGIRLSHGRAVTWTLAGFRLSHRRALTWTHVGDSCFLNALQDTQSTAAWAIPINLLDLHPALFSLVKTAHEAQHLAQQQHLSALCNKANYFMRLLHEQWQVVLASSQISHKGSHWPILSVKHITHEFCSRPAIVILHYTASIGFPYPCRHTLLCTIYWWVVTLDWILHTLFWTLNPSIPDPITRATETFAPDFANSPDDYDQPWEELSPLRLNPYI